VAEDHVRHLMNDDLQLVQRRGLLGVAHNIRAIRAHPKAAQSTGQSGNRQER
jgi:hypothetical protein